MSVHLNKQHVQSESSARVVNTLLTELDGLDERKSVYVIGATNRPDMIDPAMCRPGRLDKLLYVDLPTADERAEIIRTLTRKLPIASDELNGSGLANLVRERCEGFSGADLSALVREAGVVALRRLLGAFNESDATAEFTESAEVVVALADFEKARAKIGPSVSAAHRRRYEALRSKFSGFYLKPSNDAEDTSKTVI
jgi:ribosome biogenesis ATPase